MCTYVHVVKKIYKTLYKNLLKKEKCIKSDIILTKLICVNKMFTI